MALDGGRAFMIRRPEQKGRAGMSKHFQEMMHRNLGRIPPMQSNTGPLTADMNNL
jgi:hypothetical protein